MFSLHSWRQRIRRWSRAAYRNLRHPKKLKLSAWRRWVGRFALDRRLWRHEKHRTSLGLAIGAFISPIVIPGQMPLALLIACLMRANVPAAVVGSWIGNPATFYFFLVLEARIASWFWPNGAALALEGSMKDQASYLWNQLIHHPSEFARCYVTAPFVGLFIGVLTYFISLAIFTAWERYSTKQFPLTKPF